MKPKDSKVTIKWVQLSWVLFQRPEVLNTGGKLDDRMANPIIKVDVVEIDIVVEIGFSKVANNESCPAP